MTKTDFRQSRPHYAGIDYFRLIAAFMVTAIHISPFSVWNTSLDYLVTYCIGRIAVPFFFLTTGYFVLAPYVFSHFKKKSLIRKYLVKNIRLYLIATVIYLPISVYSGNIPHSAAEFARQLIFDGTFYHLWYFPAVITGCMLLVCLARRSLRTAVCFSAIAYVIGYADGIPRELSNRGFALINGRRAAIIGLICMDQLTLDVTDIDGVSCGDEAVFIGKSKNSEITATGLAGSAGTISNEILSRLGSRLERITV